MASKKKEDKMLEKCVKAMNDFRMTMSQRSIEDSLKFVSIDEPPHGELEQTALDQNQLAHFHLRVTGGLADPYGDGEQTQLSGTEAQIMRCRWVSGGDYNPFDNPTLSQWVRDCYNGNLPAVKAQAEKDPTLIEKRESILRLSALFHVIAGARTIDPALPIPREMKARITSKSDHIGCIEYLLKKGARVNARDLAGHTPLFYCTGVVGNSLTLKIAELLLKHEADINATNRMGCTPLFEPAISSKFECIDFLLEHGARVDVTDNDGVILGSLGALYPKLASKFAMAYAIQAAKDKEEAKLAGTYGACNECKTTSNVRRCTGCFVVWYCGTECQKKDWANHKSRCKSVRKGYKKVTLKSLPYQSNINYLNKLAEMRSNMPSNGVSPDLKPKQHFIVKIQLPLALITSRKTKKNLTFEKEGQVYELCVYNEERSVSGKIGPSFEYYNQLVDLILEKGAMGGSKGYFCAIYDEKEGLKINVEEIQLQQPW